MQPDRSHMHHRLIDVGFSQRQAVGILCTVSGLLSLTAVVLITAGIKRTLLMVVVSLVYCVGGIIYIKNKNYEQKFLQELSSKEGYHAPIEETRDGTSEK